MNIKGIVYAAKTFLMYILGKNNDIVHNKLSACIRYQLGQKRAILWQPCPSSNTHTHITLFTSVRVCLDGSKANVVFVSVVYSKLLN